MSMSPERLATTIAAHAADKKAIDIVALDLRGVAGYTDFFVICSGNTDRQTKAIHDAIHKGLKDEHGLLPRRVEGVTEARWILMDYLDVVVHVFTPETRDFYRLEALWGDVPRQRLRQRGAAGRALRGLGGRLTRAGRRVARAPARPGDPKGPADLFEQPGPPTPDAGATAARPIQRAAGPHPYRKAAAGQP